MLAQLQTELGRVSDLRIRLVAHPDVRDFEFIEPAFADRVRLAVAELPEEFRHAVLLRDMQGLLGSREQTKLQDHLDAVERLSSSLSSQTVCGLPDASRQSICKPTVWASRCSGFITQAPSGSCPAFPSFQAQRSGLSLPGGRIPSGLQG